MQLPCKLRLHAVPVNDCKPMASNNADIGIDAGFT
jgi:hypothetical protein